MVVILLVRNGRNVPIPTEAFGETGMYREELEKDGKGFQRKTGDALESRDSTSQWQTGADKNGS